MSSLHSLFPIYPEVPKHVSIKKAQPSVAPFCIDVLLSLSIQVLQVEHSYLISLFPIWEFFTV